MSLHDKSISTIDSTFTSLQSVQAAGWKALAAVAEKTPGLPSVVATTTTRGASAWVQSYFTIAQGVLETERQAAEQLVSVNGAFISPRRQTENGAQPQAV